MKNLNFYLFLIQKKINTRIHNLLETKVINDSILSDEQIISFLWSEIKKKLKKVPQGLYYRTEVTNNNSPMTLAQSRVLLSICMNIRNSKIDINDTHLIDGLTSYILTMKGKNGIYKFNQKKWNLQDEGIATIWVLLALLEVYKINFDKKILDEIITTINIVNKVLFSETNSLAHTHGDDYWCLNAASTYAWFITELYPYYSNTTLVENLKLSINLCNEKFNREGYFPYSEKKTGTYLLLYNPVVIYSLERAIRNDKLNEELVVSTKKNIKQAKDFVLKQRDENNFFIEPEVKVFSRYLVSNVVSLVALKGYIDQNLEKSILENVKSYVINDRLYLCRNEYGEYYNGNLYEVNDVLLTEFYYWLTIYTQD